MPQKGSEPPVRRNALGMQVNNRMGRTVIVLPLQGDYNIRHLPRALPWAIFLWPFRPLIGLLQIIINGRFQK